LNAWLYSLLLPEDLPGYFTRYPFAVGVGTLNYFLITIIVEGLYAFRWLRKNQQVVSRSSVWKGILVANLVTYAVVSPLHYLGTRPIKSEVALSTSTAWSRNADTKILFTDENGRLISIRANGSGSETVVPGPVRDYLVASNLDVCLFRGKDGNLYLYRRATGQSNLIWETHERFVMDQVAFSPSGQRVAYGKKEGNAIELLDLASGKRIHQVLLPQFRQYSFDGPRVVWSKDEMSFYVGGFESNGFAVVNIQPDQTIRIEPLETTNGLAILPWEGWVVWR
jgi:WD40 repeat protein